MKKMTKTFVWYNAKEVRPDKSGEYFVICENGYAAVLSYSKQWDAFNAHDGDEPISPFEDIVCWTPFSLYKVESIIAAFLSDNI